MGGIGAYYQPRHSVAPARLVRTHRDSPLQPDDAIEAIRQAVARHNAQRDGRTGRAPEVDPA